MKPILSLCLPLLGLCSVAVADTDFDARISVSRLLFHADGHPVTPTSPAWSEKSRHGIATDQVRMYIAGVVDTGEGTAWCTQTSGSPPHDIDARLLKALRSQTAADTETSAAAAIQDALRAFYPCE